MSIDGLSDELPPQPWTSHGEPGTERRMPRTSRLAGGGLGHDRDRVILRMCKHNREHQIFGASERVLEEVLRDPTVAQQNIHGRVLKILGEIPFTEPLTMAGLVHGHLVKREVVEDTAEGREEILRGQLQQALARHVRDAVRWGRVHPNDKATYSKRFPLKKVPAHMLLRIYEAIIRGEAIRPLFYTNDQTPSERHLLLRRLGFPNGSDEDNSPTPFDYFTHVDPKTHHLCPEQVDNQHSLLFFNGDRGCIPNGEPDMEKVFTEERHASSIKVPSAMEEFLEMTEGKKDYMGPAQYFQWVAENVLAMARRFCRNLDELSIEEFEKVMRVIFNNSIIKNPVLTRPSIRFPNYRFDPEKWKETHPGETLSDRWAHGNIAPMFGVHFFSYVGNTFGLRGVEVNDISPRYGRAKPIIEKFTF